MLHFFSFNTAHFPIKTVRVQYFVILQVIVYKTSENGMFGLEIGHSSFRRTYESVKNISTVGKSIPNFNYPNSISNCDVWLPNIIKCVQFGPVKFAIFLYFCNTHGKGLPLCCPVLSVFARNTKVYKICKLHGTIFSTFYCIFRPKFTILLN